MRRVSLVPPIVSLLLVLAACSGSADEAATGAGAVEGTDGAAATGEDAVGWSYDEVSGPSQWGMLSSDWATCAHGRGQSPIDLTDADRFEPSTVVPRTEGTTTASTAGRADTASSEAGAASAGVPGGATAEQSVEFRYRAGGFRSVDTGNMVRVEFDDPGALYIDGDPYLLSHIDLHVSSEHALAGVRYPLEYQFVHRNASGALAVVGVLGQRGYESAPLSKVLAALTSPAGHGAEQAGHGAEQAGHGAEQAGHGAEALDPTLLLPENRSMARYDGSLTSPPCSEGVRWHLLLAPVQVSAGQLAQLTARHPDNVRPLQERNGRTVVVEIVAEDAADEA